MNRILKWGLIGLMCLSIFLVADSLFASKNFSECVVHQDSVANQQTSQAKDHPSTGGVNRALMLSRCTISTLNASSNGLVALGTIVLAIVTSLLAIYTYGLWSQGREMGKRQLRAYVVVTTSPEEGAVTLISSWVLEVMNTGQTPATHTEAAWELFLVDAAGVEIEKLASGKTILGVIARDHFSNVKVSLEKACGHAASFRPVSRSRNLRVSGTISYRDVFNDNHTTNFKRNAKWNEVGNRLMGDEPTLEGNDAT